MKRGRKPKTELSPEIAAISRLSEDGASSNAAIRKRIALIAAERKLPAAETKKVMGRLLTYDIKLFTEKHHVSVDWLICGDLKGLLRTVQGCPSRPRQDIVREETTRQEFRRLLLQLKPDQLPALVEILRRQFDNDGDVA